MWAESLGKDGQGSTPVSVLGPVDQHSQLQLSRDGPGNALFTIMTVDTKGQGAAVPGSRAKASDAGTDAAERNKGKLGAGEGFGPVQRGSAGLKTGSPTAKRNPRGR